MKHWLGCEPMPSCSRTGRRASTWSRQHARRSVAPAYPRLAQLFPLIPAVAKSRGGQPDRSRQRRRVSGLVLAILGVPGVELVEADSRKCAFLREAARVAAAPVTIRNARIQTVPAHPVAVVTARACAPLDRLLSYSQRFIGPETVCLFPKGEQAGQELAVAQQAMGFRCHEPSEPDRSARGHSVLERVRPVSQDRARI